MISTILGVFWILVGVLGLIRPQFLQARIGKKSNRKLRWTLIGFIVFLVLNLLGVAFRFESLVLKGLSIVGIAFLAKMAWGIQSKASNKFLSWWSELPVVVFRAIALGCLVSGVFLVYT
jgi:hypothetical protein